MGEIREGLQEHQAPSKRSGVCQDLDKCPKGGTPAVIGGDAMPKTNFTLRLEVEELKWLHQEAQDQNRSIGNLIRYILREYKLTHSSSTETDIK